MSQEIDGSTRGDAILDLLLTNANEVVGDLGVKAVWAVVITLWWSSCS